MHQICSQCGKDQTKKVLESRKIGKTSVKNRSGCVQKAKSDSFALLGVGSVLWLFLVALYLPFLSSTVTYAAEPQKTETFIDFSENLPLTKEPEVMKLETHDQIRDYVLSEAKKAGVHVAKIDHIVENESHYDPKAVGDKDVPCTNKKSPLYGKPAHARGIWQLTRCWYGTVTDEQAESVEWSTKFALDIIAHSKKDCISQWSQCRVWYNTK